MPQVASGSVRPKITVVIPAVGEARNLSSVFSRLQAELHVIAIDGHSVDDTVAVARQPRPGVQIIQDRCGNENALACGFERIDEALLTDFSWLGIGSAMRADRDHWALMPATTPRVRHHLLRLFPRPELMSAPRYTTSGLG
jgi:glycosyltransferase involved in cell wall biosynthesis